mgnify:CR=1 FL=1
MAIKQLIINTWNTEYDAVTDAAVKLGYKVKFMDPGLSAVP